MKKPVTEPRYSIGELAELGSVSRRTVHFYVQQGLIDPPEGRGRGSYYTDRHLEQLQRVLALQREGLPLRRIQGMSESGQLRAAEAVPGRQLVLRLGGGPGGPPGSGGEIPSAEQLRELARRCAEELGNDS